ncbi:MAG TPA: hypothetical protein VGE47_13775, partial [Burkholderiaceae bacterium]
MIPKPLSNAAACAAQVFVLALLLAGCSHPALREAEALRRGNQPLQAFAVLDSAAKADPGDRDLRTARLRLREQLTAQLLVQIEGLRAASRWEAAQEALTRLREVDPQQPRLANLASEIERGQRHETQLQQARALLREGQTGRAEALVVKVLAESPAHPAARQLAAQIARARPLEQ